MRRSSPGRMAVAGFAVVLLLVVLLTDWLSTTVSGFWSGHAMLTNLVSSGVFAFVTVAVIDWWLKKQERRRLMIVRSVAYNAVARGPIAQRRIMWFLVYGGELRFVPEFRLSDHHVQELGEILARLDLPEISEHMVMERPADRPEISDRFAPLAQDQQWRALVHDVLLDVVHQFRVLVARWSALLLATDESCQALKDLAEQTEELSDVFVAFDGHRPASDYTSERLEKYRKLWNRAFANAVAMEETFIDLGGERRTGDDPRFTTPVATSSLPLTSPHSRPATGSRCLRHGACTNARPESPGIPCIIPGNRDLRPTSQGWSPGADEAAVNVADRRAHRHRRRPGGNPRADQRADRAVAGDPRLPRGATSSPTNGPPLTLAARSAARCITRWTGGL